MHKQGAPLSPCSFEISLSQELHRCSNRCYFMWCPKFSNLVYCFHLFQSRFLHQTNFPPGTDNAVEKSPYPASRRAFDLPYEQFYSEFPGKQYQMHLVHHQLHCVIPSVPKIKRSISFSSKIEVHLLRKSHLKDTCFSKQCSHEQHHNLLTG